MKLNSTASDSVVELNRVVYLNLARPFELLADATT